MADRATPVAGYLIIILHRKINSEMLLYNISGMSSYKMCFEDGHSKMHGFNLSSGTKPIKMLKNVFHHFCGMKYTAIHSTHQHLVYNHSSAEYLSLSTRPGPSPCCGILDQVFQVWFEML